MDNLEHLMGAYFYEDWDEHEYSSWQHAVDDFVRRSPERAQLVPGEIDALMASSTSDAELETRLTEFGLSYTPSEGTRPWLLEVRAEIRHRLDQT